MLSFLKIVSGIMPLSINSSVKNEST